MAVHAVVAVASAAALLAGCWHGTRASQTFAAQARQVQRSDPNLRPWFCNAVGTGTPPSGHGNGSHVHPYYTGKTKGPLSWSDCLKLAGQLDQTMAAVKGLETKAKGEAAGWREVASYIPGLGTHHVKMSGTPGGVPPGSIPRGITPGSMPGLDIEALQRCLRDKGTDISSGAPPNLSEPAFTDALRACGVPLPAGSVPGFATTFDPAKPPLLIYGGPQDDAPLVGMSFFFTGGGDPPEAYAGGNDWFHLHSTACVDASGRPVGGGEEFSDEECTRRGGRNMPIGLPGSPNGAGVWLLHLWLPPFEYRPDNFVSGHPCLLADGVAPKDDPCWAIAHRDPSLGPPPTSTPAGDHGDQDH